MRNTIGLQPDKKRTGGKYVQHWNDSSLAKLLEPSPLVAGPLLQAAAGLSRNEFWAVSERELQCLMSPFPHLECPPYAFLCFFSCLLLLPHQVLQSPSHTPPLQQSQGDHIYNIWVHIYISMFLIFDN